MSLTGTVIFLGLAAATTGSILLADHLRKKPVCPRCHGQNTVVQRTGLQDSDDVGFCRDCEKAFLLPGETK